MIMGANSDYIYLRLQPSLQMEHLFIQKEDLQRDDIRPYIKDGVVNLYMSWIYECKDKTRNEIVKTCSRGRVLLFLSRFLFFCSVIFFIAGRKR